MAHDHGPMLSDSHGVWQRGGADIENLPDPFAHFTFPGDAAPPEGPERPRRRWLRWGFTAFGALLLVTLLVGLSDPRLGGML